MEQKSVADWRAMVRRWAKPSVCLEQDERFQVQKLAEIGKSAMRTELLAQAGRATGPVILSIFADAKPLTMRDRRWYKVGNTKFTREGGVPRKLFGIRQFLLCKDGQQAWHCKQYFRDPFPLVSEKHYQLLECIRANGLPFLHELRPGGCVNITSIHLDGGVYFSLAKKFNAMVDVEARQTCHDESRIHQLRFLLQQWVVGNKCCEHVAHKAFEWAIMPKLEHRYEEKVVDMHICCASLRTGFGQLQTALPRFMSESMKLRARENDKDLVKEFWGIFSHLTPDAIHELTELDLWHDGTNLLVDDMYALREDVMGRVASAVMAAAKIKNYTSSRMLSQGEACSGMTASQCLGLDDWVDVAKIVADSDWHIKGYKKRMQDDLRVHSAIATLVSRVGNRFVLELFKDDRLLKHPEYQQNVVDNIRGLSELSSFVYGRLAVGACRNATTAVDLLDDTMVAANILGAYVWFNAFRLVAAPPWAWTQGDIKGNLLQAMQEPKPACNLTAAKIWTMLHCGFDIEEVADAVAALRNVSWATHIIEQFHAAPGMMSKLHGRYGPETILARSVVYNLNPMLSPEEDTTLARLDAQLDRVAKRRCTTSATALFNQDARMSLADLESPPLRSEGKENNSIVMPQIAALLRASSTDVKCTYKKMAAEKRREQVTETEIEMQRIRTNIKDHVTKKCLVDADRPLVRSSASRLTASTVQGMMSDMLPDSRWSRKRVRDSRAHAREIPLPTNEELQKIYESINCPEFTEEKLDQGRLVWARPIAERRQLLRHTAFLLGPRGEHGMWMFAMATLRPINVIFTKLRLKARAFECSSIARGSADTFWEEELNFHAWLFETDFEYDDASSITVPLGAEWHMLPGVTWSHNSTLFCDHEPMPFFEHAPCMLPEKGEKDKEEQEDDLSITEGKDLADLLTLFPWAAERYLERAPKPMMASSDGPPRTRATRPPGLADPLALTDAEIAGILARVERKRVELDDIFSGMLAPEFKVVPRGGVNTFKACGMAIDSIRGQGSSEQSASWCERYGLAKTATFAVLTYTMELAEHLAGAWCHKMNFFWHIWEESGGDLDFVYTKDSIESYEPTTEFHLILMEVREGDAHFRRVQEILYLRPS